MKTKTGISEYIPSWGYITTNLTRITGDYNLFLKSIYSGNLSLNNINDYALTGDGLLKVMIIESLAPVVRYNPENPNFIEALYHKRISNNYLEKIYNVLNLDNYCMSLDKHKRKIGTHRKATHIEFIIYSLYKCFGYHKTKQFIQENFLLDMLYICIFKNKKRSYYHTINTAKAILEWKTRELVVEYNQNITIGKTGISHKQVSQICSNISTELYNFYRNKYQQRSGKHHRMLHNDVQSIGSIYEDCGISLFFDKPSINNLKNLYTSEV